MLTILTFCCMFFLTFSTGVSYFYFKAYMVLTDAGNWCKLFDVAVYLI